MRERQYTGDGYGRERNYGRHYMREDMPDDVRSGDKPAIKSGSFLQRFLSFLQEIGVSWFFLLIFVDRGVDYSGRSDISVDSIERDPERTWLEQMRARGSRVVQVTYPRTANNPKELTVNRGEFLEASAVFDPELKTLKGITASKK